MERMCSMCGQVKDESEYKIKIYRTGTRKPHMNCYCNNCQRLYIKEYMRIYRERRKANDKS